MFLSRSFQYEDKTKVESAVDKPKFSFGDFTSCKSVQQKFNNKNICIYFMNRDRTIIYLHFD